MSNDIEKQTLIPKLEKPHQKTYLTTPIGRFVERASYLDLFIFGFVVILSSALYFWLSPSGHSLNKENIDIFDALYFSIVTFTSLGYGDLIPIGYGRLIATLVVVLGLIFIALLVGKFASERQQTILLLLHTSDCQRRISNFSLEIEEINALLKKGSNIEKDLHVSANILEITAKYLIFNANQARLISFGNESALASLYKEISKLQETSLKIHKNENENLLISRRSLALVNRCHGVVRHMVVLHKNSKEDKSYTQLFIIKLLNFLRIKQQKSLSGSMLRINGTFEKMNNDIILLKRWSQGKATPIIINDVYNNAPIGPKENWPTNIHKEIAKTLGISNNLVSKSINILLEKRKLPNMK